MKKNYESSCEEAFDADKELKSLQDDIRAEEEFAKKELDSLMEEIERGR